MEFEKKATPYDMGKAIFEVYIKSPFVDKATAKRWLEDAKNKCIESVNLGFFKAEQTHFSTCHAQCDKCKDASI